MTSVECSPSSCGSGVIPPQAMQDFPIPLVCQSVLDSMSLLMKTTHTSVIGHETTGWYLSRSVFAAWSLHSTGSCYAGYRERKSHQEAYPDCEASKLQ